ncbi:MAG TPA: sortase [Candidatus Paceibacterota bacterium]|nr:sortase [Candidatus Paceibacterota bacterium]
METSPKPSFSLFLVAAVAIFILSLSAASSIGFVPYYIDGTAPNGAPIEAVPEANDAVSLGNLPELGEEQNVQPTPQAVAGVEPERLIIQEIGLDIKVLNPETRSLIELDEVLKGGPARYVDSALLGEQGNILIFGHSSHLPVVHNQMYKVFNKIPELETGDLIALQGGGKEYVYRVTSLKQVNAEEGIIDLARTGNKLTIVTCDTLTSKSSRFVLEAELIGSYAL